MTPHTETLPLIKSKIETKTAILPLFVVKLIYVTFF